MIDISNLFLCGALSDLESGTDSSHTSSVDLNVTQTAKFHHVECLVSLMTTFATVLGVVPLLLGAGAGANSRFSIGLVIAAGMLVGTLFTLFVLPVFSLPLRDKKHKSTALAAPTPTTA